MITDVCNKIISHLAKGEEVEFSVSGNYLETNWVKNPLDVNDTSILDMYIIEEVHTQSFFTDVGYGSDGVFKFVLQGFDEECTLFLDCIVDIYDEDGEIAEEVIETLNVH
jgi:hypothetical protein